MQAYGSSGSNEPRLKAFERNRYFYGQMLDVEQFNCEQLYGIGKRWLLNRYVAGIGVICGLDVKLCEKGRSIAVTPGLALDHCGREIVVPCLSRPQPLPSAKEPSDDYSKAEASSQSAKDDECCDKGEYVHICLCYHECESDPVPVLAKDCKTEEYCVSGKIQERYRIVVKPGKAPPIDLDCPLADLISGDRINYPALAIWVTKSCPPPGPDPCIPLANVRLPT